MNAYVYTLCIIAILMGIASAIWIVRDIVRGHRDRKEAHAAIAAGDHERIANIPLDAICDLSQEEIRELARIMRGRP